MPGLVEIRPQHQPTQPPEPPTALDDHLLHFQRRVLADALLEATAGYWRRRAAAFAAVGTPACDQIALACTRRADITVDLGLDAEAEHALTMLTGITRSLMPATDPDRPDDRYDDQAVAPWA